MTIDQNLPTRIAVKHEPQRVFVVVAVYNGIADGPQVFSNQQAAQAYCDALRAEAMGTSDLTEWDAFTESSGIEITLWDVIVGDGNAIE